jgi:phosphatidylserine decarboxylase
MNRSVPPPPEQVHRQMVGQGLIDRALRLLSLTAPIARPALEQLEHVWLEAISHPSVSAAAERVSEARLPRPLLDRLISAWIKAYDVDISEAELPVEQYPTLDAFFTRKLKPGLRPIDATVGTLISPADSVLKDFGPIDDRARIPEVKGRTYSVSDLLGDAVDVLPPDAYVGGTYGVFYLSPRDYHRVHCPCDATALAVRPQPGTTYPVNALGVRRVEGLFVRNKRTVFALDTEFGKLALVMVGATNVGRITSDIAADTPVSRGDELGIFHLGSTVVLLTPRDSNLQYRGVAQGELVKVGQPVLSVTD